MFVKAAGMNESAARRLIATLKNRGRIREVIPHRGSMPAVLEFTELLEITEGVKLR